MGMMYTPKKLKWNSLHEFKIFLEKETKEKIVSFNGYILVTETTEYSLLDGKLIIKEKSKKKKK